MSLCTPWVSYAPTKPDDQIGVYELGHVTFGTVRIVYIGSGRVVDRLRAHKRSNEKQFEYYRCLYTNDRRRARQIERREQRRYLNRHDRLPAYNSRVG